MARINGNDNSNTLFGTAGDDVIVGYRGNDDLVGRAGNDTIQGNAGNDRLWGEGGRDHLLGGDGSDQLIGGAGADRLHGGAGNDSYWGGDGSDRFVFSHVPSSGYSTEYVGDFWFNDVLDFSSIDANHNVAGNQAFRWIGNTDFSGRGGELIYRFLEHDNGFQYTGLYADVDGDKSVDMAVFLEGQWFGIRPADDYIVL